MSNSVLALLDNSINSLKDFQQATVSRVVKEFQDSNHSGRVLVADEVGLGKTVVAKGVITEMLRQKILCNDVESKPLRVTYICSNLTLANENKRKLAVFDGDDHKKYVLEPSFGRLTELAVKSKQTTITGNEILEICSLTPSTSFTLTQGDGWHRERFIIYKLLCQHEDLSVFHRELSELFRGQCSDATWNNNEFWFDESIVFDECVLLSFLDELNTAPNYTEDDWHLSDSLTWLSLLAKVCEGEIICQFPNRMRSKLRRLLAHCCVKTLRSDLFILDEFQRFNALLDLNENNELSVIAREIFNRDSDAKLLLLSATPFKAMSMAEDEENQTAHVDELRYLLKFLTQEDEKFLSNYESNRRKLHSQIIELRNPEVKLSDLQPTYKNSVESALSTYICRTERVQVAKNAENLVNSKKGSVQACESLAKFGKDEITAFKELDNIAAGLQERTKKTHSSFLLEYQKSAPWTLSFMNGYQFKKHIDESLRESSLLAKLIENASMNWLSRDSVHRYKLDLTKHGTNARFKATLDAFFDGKGEELLWVPPTNPHYPLEGSFKEQNGFSKSLLFSSWAMVPRALSGLISYEAERRLLAGRRGVTKEYFKSKSHQPQIKFDSTSSLVGWSYIYPSRVLAKFKTFGFGLDLKELVDNIDKQLKPFMNQLDEFTSGKKSKTNWYAVAPIFLDLLEGYESEVQEWRTQTGSKLHDGRSKSRLDSFNHLFRLIDSKALGPLPYDLSRYLAELAIASPAICLFRSVGSLGHFVCGADISQTSLGFISLFNKPESELAIRKGYSKLPYWRSVVRYCADGNLQAVIDEYCHLLFDTGLNSQGVIERLSSVLGFNTVSIGCHFLEDIKRKKYENAEEAKSTLRCHYAVPLGNQKMTDEKGVVRVAHIRDAFNSPFRPFVLNSTSIGQEGLDFHWYCSRIVHWNLPSNPIDIEQREGRVNRYKSLVVRKRLVELFRNTVNGRLEYCWNKLFQYADEYTKADRCSDLVPFWHLPEGNAKIERVVPLMPMSKDLMRLNESLKILSLYRLAFGQPRQEELIDNLLERDFSDNDIELLKRNLVINLSPMKLKQ
eukprot:TRINITY_DN5_c0_g4_i1.p1 TRINITY_DN5_c0_g4~~TRINITY_DN5_c0_g4_i1.p1  ORF type:complete len:1072 (+),score=126.80 TRINITY_DN5_c0_g4_i1:8546-11761(+)